MATVFAAASALKENGGFSNSDFVYGAQTPTVGAHDALIEGLVGLILIIIAIVCVIACIVVACVYCLKWLLSDGDGEPAEAKLQRYLGGISGQASHKKLGASKDGDDSVVVMLV